MLLMSITSVYVLASSLDALVGDVLDALLALVALRLAGMTKVWLFTTMKMAVHKQQRSAWISRWCGGTRMIHSGRMYSVVKLECNGQKFMCKFVLGVYLTLELHLPNMHPSMMMLPRNVLYATDNSVGVWGSSGNGIMPKPCIRASRPQQRSVCAHAGYVASMGEALYGTWIGVVTD